MRAGRIHDCVPSTPGRSAALLVGPCFAEACECGGEHDPDPCSPCTGQPSGPSKPASSVTIEGIQGTTREESSSSPWAGRLRAVSPKHRLSLTVRYECCWDTKQSFLAVEESLLHVFPEASTDPLLRVEYYVAPRKFRLHMCRCMLTATHTPATC